ncbi:MAG: flap endonuclease GEN protein 1 [Trebouxia sp. A1-2]|nr:MAG: flap endonuclease GEN protein 1 [Trebouxia sp. A1-2]
MGVSELWSLLKAVGITQLSSGLEGTHAQVVKEVDDKSIAIDLSAWIVQATCQPNLAEAFSDPASQALVVSFNRVVNYLRYGCLPVCITEGRPPAEKLERLQQRFRTRTGQTGGGGTNHHFSKMGSSIADMLHNMGLPVVQAPGEGEAMCAALNAAGLVDACATFDGDVLLFGAHTVYHTLKLQSNQPQNSEVLKVELAGIQSMLGIEAGGPDALVALSLLCGGDYAVKGAEHVGSRQAIRLVHHLLQGCQNDEEVLDKLSDLVADPPDPEMELLSAQGCTGCKRCKHAGNRKGSIQKHTNHNPCSCCPDDFVQEYQTCEAHPELPCQCDFHVKEPQRHIDKAVRRIQATPGFTGKAAEAAAAYHKQRQQAATAVELVRRRYAVPAGQTLSWMKRPDVHKVAQQLDWLSEDAVRSKLLPLLMQWDLCHPHEAECEFVAEGISKVHVQKADKEEDCWRYMLRWYRLPHVNAQLVEADNLWLKKSDSEKRSVKISLVRQHKPELTRMFEQEQRDKLVKKSKGGQKKAAAKASKPASAPITNYFSQQKHPAAISKVLVRKDDTDATELAQPSRPSKGLASMAQPLQAAQNSPPWANPAPPGRSGRVNLSAEPEPDLMALSRASLSESVSRRLPAETAAGSSHDAQLEQLLAYTASQELELQLPHASRVRQQDKSQAETPLQRHLTVLYNTQIESHQVEEPCVSSRTGLDDSHAMASQFVGSPRAGQLDDQFREGRVEGMSNAGHCQATPNALTAQLDVHTTPKRPTAANSEDVIVISPESQVQDDVEVDLLSPSPAKRRKTPPCSPHIHAAATGTDSAGDASHDLRPAGPCAHDAQPMPSAATALLREALHEPKQATGSTRLSLIRHPLQGPVEAQSLGLAQRGRQVNRWGRAGGSRAGPNMPQHTAAASTPPLDSEQLGFVRLAAFRLDGAMHNTQPSDPTSPKGPSLRAGDSTAAPDTASTVVWGDIEVPISPADSPVTHPQTDLRQHASRVGNDVHELQPSPEPLQLSSPASPNQIGNEETCTTMHGRDLQHDGRTDLTPVHYMANVQWQSKAGPSPIDLVTPSSGVASIVATPTFSESGDLVDLTQT